MAKQKKIYIVDVTNRDGVQTSRLGLAKLQKTMINIYLNEMGVAQSEFGFPVTRHETNYLNANVELARMGVLKPIILSGWIRAITEDVERAHKMTKVDPRIVRINDFYVDFVPEGNMLMVFNKDVPGIIGHIGTIFGKNDINVASVSFGREEKGGRAISVWNVDSNISKKVLDEIRESKNVYELKLVKL